MVNVPLRVRPGASRTRVGGAHPGPYGTALVVAVTAPAVDGRATRAALDAVAEALGVRRADVTLRAGERSRDKLAEITDPPADLHARITALLGPAVP
ncbi:MAG TPA: DUF167 domain-containing protein [Micromonosporaceae bacterium]|nr:DUF167 domain-containing protein [Micromonosporaceae bacterium]